MPTRDQHMGTLKTKKKVFIAGQTLHQDLVESLQLWASQFFIFMYQATLASVSKNVYPKTEL